MFESLGDRLQSAISKIKGYGKITEDNISEVTREIRLALLEADVNYKVVKEFIILFLFSYLICLINFNILRLRVEARLVIMKLLLIG